MIVHFICIRYVVKDCKITLGLPGTAVRTYLSLQFAVSTHTIVPWFLKNQISLIKEVTLEFLHSGATFETIGTYL